MEAGFKKPAGLNGKMCGKGSHDVRRGVYYRSLANCSGVFWKFSFVGLLVDFGQSCVVFRCDRVL